MPTATLAFLAFTFSTTLAMAGTRAFSRLGDRHQRLHVGRGGHDVHHGLAGAAALAHA